MRATTIEGQNALSLFQRSALSKFHVKMVKTHVIRLRVIEGPIASDQIEFCAFHSFLVEVQTNPGYILACVAWRFGRAGRTSGEAEKFAREARERALAVSVPSPTFIT